MTITILGKPGCFGYAKTRHKFEEAGLSPAYRDATQDLETLALLRGMGYNSAPVVIVVQNGDDLFSWSGLDPVKIHDAFAVERDGNR
jgi:glutaredoxin-like protein NrdH